MESRAGESIATALETKLGLAYSLKQYEDIAYQFSYDINNNKQKNIWIDKDSTGTNKSPIDGNSNSNSNSNHNYYDKKITGLQKLQRWRDLIDKKRLRSMLFNTKSWTKNFEQLMFATWELAHISNLVQQGTISFDESNKRSSQRGIKSNDEDDSNNYDNSNRKLYHLFSVKRSPNEPIEEIQTHQLYTEGSIVFEPKDGDKASQNSIHDNYANTNSDVEINNISTDNQKSKKNKKTSYPPIPRYVFDKKLIMLNIGK